METLETTLYWIIVVERFLGVERKRVVSGPYLEIPCPPKPEYDREGNLKARYFVGASETNVEIWS